ncbi:MAG: aminotransferase class V-fold PLP-dependent enzyme [Dehalococcoidia bacterium]
MSIYEELGVRTIINVSGASTRVSGPLMPPEVAEAMVRASQESVSMMELQAVASEKISEVTGAEAGYIISGASAGLTLGTATILAGMDPGRMDRLPDTTGMKNEFIIAREHRNGYDHAIRLAGAKFVEIGMNEIVSGAGVRRTEAWEYEAAITPQTAGIAYTVTPDSQPPLEQVVDVAHRHGVPVLVDAAGELPPISNLRKFIGMDADLVAFSGGKSIRGPQSSGILCGRRDLIASAAVQHLDMDEFFDIWDPPESLIPKGMLTGIPRHGIGRGFKVGKEEIVGLLTALRMFADGEYAAETEQQRGLLEYIADGLSGLPVQPRIILPAGEGYPMLHLIINSQTVGKSGFEVSKELKSGDPGIFVNEKGLPEDTLIVHPMNLNHSRTEIMTRRLQEVLGYVARPT